MCSIGRYIPRNSKQPLPHRSLHGEKIVLLCSQSVARSRHLDWDCSFTQKHRRDMQQRCRRVHPPDQLSNLLLLSRSIPEALSLTNIPSSTVPFSAPGKSDRWNYQPPNLLQPHHVTHILPSHSIPLLSSLFVAHRTQRTINGPAPVSPPPRAS